MSARPGAAIRRSRPVWAMGQNSVAAHFEPTPARVIAARPHQGLPSVARNVHHTTGREDRTTGQLPSFFPVFRCLSVCHGQGR